MWLWGTLLGIIAVLGVVAVLVQRRRGPSDGDGGGVDFNVTNRSGAEHDGTPHGPMSGGV